MGSQRAGRDWATNTILWERGGEKMGDSSLIPITLPALFSLTLNWNKAVCCWMPSIPSSDLKTHRCTYMLTRALHIHMHNSTCVCTRSVFISVFTKDSWPLDNTHGFECTYMHTFSSTKYCSSTWPIVDWIHGYRTIHIEELQTLWANYNL